MLSPKLLVCPFEGLPSFLFHDPLEGMVFYHAEEEYQIVSDAPL